MPTTPTPTSFESPLPVTAAEPPAPIDLFSSDEEAFFSQTIEHLLEPEERSFESFNDL